jgi:hypothetical protein
MNSILGQIRGTELKAGGFHGKIATDNQFNTLVACVQELEKVIDNGHSQFEAGAGQNASTSCSSSKTAPTLPHSTTRTRADIEADRVSLRNERAGLQVRLITEDDPENQQIIGERLEEIQTKLSQLSKEWKKAGT